jgi:hypothetical protein
MEIVYSVQEKHTFQLFEHKMEYLKIRQKTF